MEHVTTEKLMQDLRAVIADAEELLRATAGQSGERMAELRARAEESLRRARSGLKDAAFAAEDEARAAAHAADRYVHDNPWAAVGIAAGVGFILGALLSRR